MENIEAMLCAYVEGDLDATGKAQIEKHLQDHPQHRKLLDELMAMRELVRALPKAKAPMDVGDSLRQKVERSMLLEDGVAATPQRQRVDRWPQFFGIAAVFLLFASLCFILYKALGPTLKPAVFTQATVQEKLATDKAPEAGDGAPPQVAVDSMTTVGQKLAATAAPGRGVAVGQAAAPSQDQLAVVTPSVSAEAERAVKQTPEAGGLLQKTQNFALQSQQQVQQQMSAVLDMQAIRRRLENSGYGINRVANAKDEPMLVVVDSTDVPATKAQMNLFFKNNSGMSWAAVPADKSLKLGSTTMPSDMASGTLTRSSQLEAIKNQSELSNAVGEPLADIYVAKGLTPERVDALRQTLTVPPNGSEVQVTVSSAEGLATTQPSVARAKDTSALDKNRLGTLDYSMKPAVTQPSPEVQANAPADIASSPAASPTTLPSSPGVAANFDASISGGGNAANNGTVLSDDAGENLQPVDAVIVLQMAATAGPTTQGSAPVQTPAMAAPPSSTLVPVTQP